MPADHAGMTLAVEYPRTSYTASGALGETFPVLFSFGDDSELRVTYAGAEKSPGVHYVITGSRLTGGGVLTPIPGQAPAGGMEVLIWRVTPRDQPATFGRSIA
ncbi:MAG: hypothetical protein DI570_18905 [Phenylobacterium zucineum]|nr:MAG: hypothetical protein DI570_18905 [Phenylobacterium zucineum]